MTIATTVRHTGRESSKGTAPLCVDGAKARHAEQRRRSLGHREAQRKRRLPICSFLSWRADPAARRWKQTARMAKARYMPLIELGSV